MTPRSPAIVIREHQPSVGVVFCFPGAGALITSFLSLAESLTLPCNVVGLQPRGLDGRQEPHTSVEAAASSYLDTVLELDPRGPYRLLGHSFGGWVAFEIARRLRSMGRKLLPVLLLDTDPPANRPEAVPKYDQLTVLERYLRQFEKHARPDANSGTRQFGFASEREELNGWVRMLRSTGRVAESTLQSPLYRSFRVYEANVNTAYTPETPLGEDIYLFQTADIDPDESEAISLEESRKKWRVWAPNLKPIFCAGNHMTMLRRPNIDCVAELAGTLWLSDREA